MMRNYSLKRKNKKKLQLKQNRVLGKMKTTQTMKVPEGNHSKAGSNCQEAHISMYIKLIFKIGFKIEKIMMRLKNFISELCKMPFYGSKKSTEEELNKMKKIKPESNRYRKSLNFSKINLKNQDKLKKKLFSLKKLSILTQEIQGFKCMIRYRRIKLQMMRSLQQVN